jgi:hypothetical protein
LLHCCRSWTRHRSADVFIAFFIYAIAQPAHSIALNRRLAEIDAMSVLDDTFNPATLARTDTATSGVSTLKATPAPTAKSSKSSQNYPRIDFEPLYAELKSLISDNWATYYDALTRFIRGMSLLIWPWHMTDIIR